MPKNTPRKPTGKNGLVRMSFSPKRSLAEFQPIEFPTTKEEIEKLIVGGFLKAAKEQNLLDNSVEEKQNQLDDFDFTLSTAFKEKSLELMEIAPLENLSGSYKSAPTSYKPYDFADYIFKKLMGKSDRYSGSTGSGLILLMYITDWRFVLNEMVITLLEYWSLHKQHSFERIYCYSPITSDEGVLSPIYPTPNIFRKDFNPESYKEKLVQNLDPKGWS